MVNLPCFSVFRTGCCIAALLLLLTVTAFAQTAPAHPPLSRSDIIKPCTGAVVHDVDTSTLTGKVMCGYQGWFAMPGDGADLGAVHWGAVLNDPPRASVDLWPDVSELSPEEKFATHFKHKNGETAYVFSSVVRQTVLRHFQWMRQYNIDGVFVQRFLSQIGDTPRGLRTNAVLSHCRDGANEFGRSFAVMYDTSFDRAAVDKMKTDWQMLVQEMKLLDTHAYQKHKGSPVIALWGYGFRDRAFDKQACTEFFEFLKAPENGQCTILLGVENNWRDWPRGSQREKELYELLERFGDIVQPWTVGRYSTLDGAAEHFAKYVPDDLAWCQQRSKDYYVVAFPGFSWANLRNGSSPLNQIPRQGGRFFWQQVELARQHNLNMLYVAMFDEVDEGTAIFKCTNHPPVGRFVTYEGLPSDFYLRLTGLAGRVLRGDKDVTFPEVNPDRAELGYEPVSLRQFYRNEFTFTPEFAARLQKKFQDTPITLVGTHVTCSSWIFFLSEPALPRVRELTWAELLQQNSLLPAEHPLLILGQGSEMIGGPAPEEEPERVVARLVEYVQQGGTLVVLSGGKYPAYQPGQGRLAKQLGLQLSFLPDEKLDVKILGPFYGIGSWSPTRFGSRVPMRESYPVDVTYQSLAPLLNSSGRYLGDAIAIVGPGGALGSGRVIYVASALQEHPEKQRILAIVLETALNQSLNR